MQKRSNAKRGSRLTADCATMAGFGLFTKFKNLTEKKAAPIVGLLFVIGLFAIQV
jgi:hypothetical protein